MRVSRLQALADGIMDAAVASVLEQRREDACPSQHWLGRWGRVMKRGAAPVATAELSPSLDLGGIAVACALNYLSYRFHQFDWKAEHPQLAQWHTLYTSRPSFNQTTPP